MRKFQLPLALVVAAGFIGAGRFARAGSAWDLSITATVNPNSTYSDSGTFTKDGVPIGSFSHQFVNGTNAAVTKTFTAAAPAGTNDREYSGTQNLLVAAANLPDNQVADYGAFLASNGFVGAKTFDTPAAVVTSGMSAYEVITNINAFLPFANDANFALGSTLTTDSNGQVTGLPGLTFYSDAADTTPLVDSQLTVVSILAESAVPEPSSLTLCGISTLFLLGFLWHRRHRDAIQGEVRV